MSHCMLLPRLQPAGKQLEKDQLTQSKFMLAWHGLFKKRKKLKTANMEIKKRKRCKSFSLEFLAGMGCHTAGAQLYMLIWLSPLPVVPRRRQTRM